MEIDTAAAFGVETGSEVVAGKAPGARVVKAFNTLFATDLAHDPRHDGGRRVLFYCGDDADAKATFAGVADQAGWFPVDLGSLRDGGQLMQVGAGPPRGRPCLSGGRLVLGIGAGYFWDAIASAGAAGTKRIRLARMYST